MIMYCPPSSYVGSRALARQWPAVHNQVKNLASVQNQNKQRFINETFKSRRRTYAQIAVLPYYA